MQWDALLGLKRKLRRRVNLKGGTDDKHAIRLPYQRQRLRHFGNGLPEPYDVRPERVVI